MQVHKLQPKQNGVPMETHEVATVTALPQTDNTMLTLARQVEQLEASGKLAAHYCATDMVPKSYQGKPEAGAVAIQWGAEIGLAPLQSLQNIAVINGSPALWGDALVALVKASGSCKFLTTEYDAQLQVATVSTQRVGEPVETRSYSMQDAQLAGLAGRDTYKRHPERMLQARARSHLLRDVYADLLRGIMIREIAEEDNAAYNLDGNQEPKDITPPTESETLNELLLEEPEVDFESRLNDATDLDELLAVGKEIKDAKASTKKLRLLYTARKEEITNG